MSRQNTSRQTGSQIIIQEMYSFLTQNIDTCELEQTLSLDTNPVQPRDFSLWLSDDNAPGPSSNNLPDRNESNNQIPPLFTQSPTSLSFLQPINILTGELTGISLPFFSLRSDTDHENENIFASSQCSPENTLRSTLPADSNNIHICWLGIPLSVKKLYEEIHKSLSDWSFVYAVAAQLCQDMLPMDCYVNLKMGLLLSIASIQERRADHTPISIVAFGADGASINRIMNSVGSLASRFITSIDPDPRTTIDKENLFEAGPLQLATNGVYYLEDWARVKLQVSNQIQNAVDFSKITVDKTTHEYPLECAIWTYFNCNNNSSKDLKTMSMFVNVFGVPIVLEENTTNTLMDFILEESVFGNMQPIEDELNIPFVDMKDYIKAIGILEVKMSDEASETLRAYFIATRKDRSDILSQRSFNVLKKLAESHARLCFRTSVLRRDAIAAIGIAQKFVNSMLGPGNIPSPIQGPFKHIEEVDEYMNTLESWVSDYIAKIL